MFPMWMGFLRREDHGQDLAEYCLITAVIALLGMSIFLYLSGGLQGLWNNAGNALTAANTNIEAGATGSTTGSAGTGQVHNGDRGDGDR